MPPVLFFFAILPGLLISFLIFRLDKYERESPGPMVLAFVLGAVATIPAVQFEKWIFGLVALEGPPGLLRAMLLAFLVIALIEELIKFLILRYAAYPHAFFNEPFDGIVYAVLIAMGFATAENVVYADRFGLETVLVRSLTAVPAHLMFGIIQGYYAGLARFKVGQSLPLLRKGLFISLLMHGVYDLLIIQRWAQWLFVLATAALYLSLYYGSKLVREHQNNSPFR
jgi:protease PrsW